MNKVMLVTGGSRGIGAATVRLGAKRGYAVAINYQKRADVAQNLMDEINDGGGKAIIIQANVSVESEIIEMFKSGGPATGETECLRQQCWNPPASKTTRGNDKRAFAGTF